MERSTRQEGTIISFPLALLSAVALLSDAVVPNVEGDMNPLLRFVAKLNMAVPDQGILGLVVLLGLWIAYRYYFSLRRQGVLPKAWVFSVLAVLFAVLEVVGKSVERFDSLAFLLENRFQMVYSFALIVGFAAFFNMVLKIGVHFLETRKAAPVTKGKVTVYLDRHPVLFPMCVLLACWLPYWLANLPGTLVYDMNNQFGQFFGHREMTTQHPVFGTLLYGSIMWVGRNLHSDNLGIFLCVLYQQLLFAGSLTYGLHTMKRWGVSGKFRWLTLLFFALFPVFPMWAQTLLKDSTYFALIFIFGVLLVDLIRKVRAGEDEKKALLGAVLWGIAASLIRRNGLYVVVPALFFVVFLCQNKKARAVVGASVLATALGISLLSAGLSTAFQAKKAAASHMLSVPFQQTARYVKEYPDEVTAQERAVIDGVLDYDVLAECYDPDLSDPVKGAYRGDGAKLSDYFKTWFRMFWKHPVVYMEATLSNTYSYYCPNGESKAEPIVFVGVSDKPTPEFTSHPLWPAGVRGTVRTAVDAMKSIPGVGLLMHTGTYTWILLFLIALAIYKKKYYLILGCVPSLMNLLTCVVSPVNGCFRYFLPNIYIMPVLIGWYALELAERKRKEKVPHETR